MRPAGNSVITALSIVGILCRRQLAGSANPKFLFMWNSRVNFSATSVVANAPTSRNIMAPTLTPSSPSDLFRPATVVTMSNSSNGIITVVTVPDYMSLNVVIQLARFPNVTLIITFSMAVTSMWMSNFVPPSTSRQVKFVNSIIAVFSVI